MNKYRVWLRSRPGFYEQYDGHVDVVADDEDAAPSAAFAKLRSTSFPDRSAATWKIERIERIEK